MRHLLMIVALVGLVIALTFGFHHTPKRPSGPQHPTFRPTPVPGKLNIAGLGLGEHADTVEPSLLWSRATHQGIHAFELNPNGTTRLVDGLPLQRGTQVLVGYGASIPQVEAALGKPDHADRTELLYDDDSRPDKVSVLFDDKRQVVFIRIQTAPFVAASAAPAR